jgi:hypothetical protein
MLPLSLKMNVASAPEKKTAKPKNDDKGCLIGCLIIAVLGVIGIFPWVRNFPYSYPIGFSDHYLIVEIPAFIARYLPAGFPTEIPFQPPRYVTLPPNLMGILISLVITCLACLLFVILYTLRGTVPWIVRLAISLVGLLVLGWIVQAILNWLFMPALQ